MMLLRHYADILHNAPAPHCLFSRFDGCAACAVKMELSLDRDFRAHGLLHPRRHTHEEVAWEPRNRRHPPEQQEYSDYGAPSHHNFTDSNALSFKIRERKFMGALTLDHHGDLRSLNPTVASGHPQKPHEGLTFEVS
jgi:hypothetical protein